MNKCMINEHVLIHKYRMVNEISHRKSLLTNSLLKEFIRYLIKLGSMRYQTLSTITEFKRNTEKTENEVNEEKIHISCQ